MIHGVGIDLQSITQIREMIERHPPLSLAKIFTEHERNYCNGFRSPEQHYAARWAVKEAFLKAASAGLSGGYRLIDVETVNEKSGQPRVVLHGKAREDYPLSQWSIWVSISHSGDYSIAQIVLELKDETEKVIKNE
ncbi:holo-ACP synthase [Paenibacillus tarimensis]|uniref:holo-ACP synthase n=1 Tax=Paenibacillus tarimensis TaxID=416012 RepID=UPI001F2D477D|nr:holo-ACP synthase [Paenibacillus tarimensis]MCF2945621.1 holo-ACP synthase [Paenibacillus tarimensis]